MWASGIDMNAPMPIPTALNACRCECVIPQINRMDSEALLIRISRLTFAVGTVEGTRRGF